MLLRKIDGGLRPRQHGAQALRLLAEVRLALAGRFQFFLHRLTLVLFNVGGIDVMFERPNGITPNAVLHQPVQPLIDHLGQAS